ncbi:hypothetical protein J6590_034666 [Homalodisca vitripennis]|nr:hypothetical protein J6590_034666 [Homalodisca vitripennis]
MSFTKRCLRCGQRPPIDIVHRLLLDHPQAIYDATKFSLVDIIILSNASIASVLVASSSALSPRLHNLPYQSLRRIPALRYCGRISSSHNTLIPQQILTKINYGTSRNLPTTGSSTVALHDNVLSLIQHGRIMEPPSEGGGSIEGGLFVQAFDISFSS